MDEERMVQMDNDHDLLIQLNTKMDTVLQEVQNLKVLNKELESCVVGVKTTVSTNKAQIENLEKDVEALEKKSNIFDGVLTFLTAVGTILGIAFGKNS